MRLLVIGDSGFPGRGSGLAVEQEIRMSELRCEGTSAEVGLGVGDIAPAIIDAVGEGSAFGLEVVYLQQEAPLGLAHAVLIAGEFLGGDDFVVYLGDNFIVGGISALAEQLRVARPDAQIILTQVADPREFGVAELV